MPVEYDAALVCAWLASYLVHSTLLLGTAWCITRRMPSRFDRLAELIWRLALGVPVITTLVLQLTRFAPAAVADRVPVQYTPAALAVSAVPSMVWVSLAVFWMLGAAIGLAQLSWLYRSLRLAISGRTPAGSERLGIGKLRGFAATRVSIVEGLSVPLALAHEICLPAWVVEMPADEFRAVVAHELAHVRRRDAFWRPLVSAVTRVFFFQPLNWVAAARLRELSECICDEEAIAATRSAVPLASALEAVAVRSMQRPAHLSLVPAMDSGQSFTLKRVMRILSTSDATPRPRPARALGLVAIVLGVGAFLLAPRVALPAVAFIRYTVTAQDPAGHFTLTVERGRVIGATISGRTLESSEVIQRGHTVRIADPAAGTFSLQLTPAGGVRWNPRKTGN